MGAPHRMFALATCRAPNLARPSRITLNQVNLSPFPHIPPEFFGSKGVLVEYSRLVRAEFVMTTVEMIAWVALVLLSLILSIAWLCLGGRPPSLARRSPHLVPTRNWGVVVDAASIVFLQ